MKLQFIDCDSFVLSNKTPDLVKDLIRLQEQKNLFEFGKIAKENATYSKKKTDVIGKFKNETPDTIYIDHFRALRSEAFAYTKPDEKRKKKINGLIENVTKSINSRSTKNV